MWQNLTRDDAGGQTFQLAGPTVFTLRQLVEYVSALVGKPRPIYPLSERLAMCRRASWSSPPALMSRDNVRSMKVDNVATGAPQPFGMVPTALETVAPWLGQAAPRAHYYPSAATRGAEAQPSAGPR